MLSFWKWLLTSLNRPIKTGKVRLGHIRRALTMESLERRQLLAANVTGVSYTDVNDNGTLDVSEPRLGSVTVQLYRDGGDGIFNLGSGDDMFVGTTTSAASGINQGRYTFSNINTLGNYFVVHTTPVGQVQRPSQRIQTVVVNSVTDVTNPPPLDDFLPPTISLSATPGFPGSETVDGLAGVIGGVRDLYAEATAGDIGILLGSTNNNLLLGSDISGAGKFLITYDGDPTNDAALIGDRLGGAAANTYDLTRGGTVTGFRFRIGTDNQGTTILLRVNGAGGQSVSSAIAIPITAGGVATGTLEIPFSLLTGTADLTQVGGIQFEVQTSPGSDSIIAEISFLSPVVFVRNIANLNPSSVGNPLSIGDFVFQDINDDGLFNELDSGIGNITIQLYVDSNSNGILDQSEFTNQSFPRSTTTSSLVTSAGSYRFTNLLPGSYIVVIPNSQFFGNGVLANSIESRIPSGTFGNNANRGSFVSNIGTVAPVTVVSDSNPINDGDSDPLTNLSIDFGFVPVNTNPNNPNTVMLTNGSGDGQLAVTVNGFGGFGSAVNFGSPAVYNPLGPLNAARTTFESALAIRLGNIGNRTYLRGFASQNGVVLQTPLITSNGTTATSSFTFGPLVFDLTQTVMSRNNAQGQTVGSLLTQTYSIRNTGSEDSSFELVRYIDGDLDFDGSLLDAGGRLLTAAGNEILFETDRGGTQDTDTTFFGISATGGVVPSTNRYEIDRFANLRSRIGIGEPLSDQITNDGNADGFVDFGSEYDITLALRNLFDLAPGENKIYSTVTIFGSGAPSDVDDATVPSIPGNLSGTIFNDENGDGIRQSSELPRTNVEVFLDSNTNGILDLGELRTRTNSQGIYTFSQIPNVPFNVRLSYRFLFPESPTTSGFVQTTDFPSLIQPLSTLNLTNVDFGTYTTASILGRFFNDTNGDGLQDSSESAIDGLKVFLRDVSGQPVRDGFGNVLSTTRSTASGYAFNFLVPSGKTIRTPGGQSITGPFTYIASPEIPRNNEITTNLNTLFVDSFFLFTGTLAGHATIGDINGDGLNDILVANEFSDPANNQSSISVLLNDSKFPGRFEVAQTLSLPKGSRPQSIQLVPQSSGRPSILVALFSSSTIPAKAGQGIYQFDAINKSGDPNDVFGNGRFLLEYAQLPNINLNAPVTATPVRISNNAVLNNPRQNADGPTDFVVTDLNNDGTTELLVINRRSNSLLIQGISGSLVKSSVTGVMRTGQEPLAIETGFLDDDNSPDFAVATFDGYIDYYLSKSNRIQSIFVGDRGPTDVKLRDMNLDGNVDIITNDWTNDRIHVYYLSDSGAVIRHDTLSVPNSSGAISIAITNANGLSGEVYPDIVVANEANDRISLFINQRGLGFQYTTDFYVGLTHPFFPTSPREIHAGDINDDGIDDLVIANRIGGVSIVINLAGAYFIGGLVVGDPREFAFGQRVVASSSGNQLIRSSSFSIDVSGDGQATPLDALMVINELNRRSQFSNRLVGEGESSTETSKFDVNLDGYVTPLDILIVINHLNWINQRASGNRTSSTANLGTGTGFSLGQSVDFYAAELTGDLDLVRRRLKIAAGK